MIIGERLKGLLKHYNISAKSFAKSVGVTEGMVYKYYKMEDVDFGTLSKWAEALFVPVVTFTDDYEYRKKVKMLTEDEQAALNEEMDKIKLERDEFSEYKKNKSMFKDRIGDLETRIKDLEYTIDLQKQMIDILSKKTNAQKGDRAEDVDAKASSDK